MVRKRGEVREIEGTVEGNTTSLLPVLTTVIQLIWFGIEIILTDQVHAILNLNQVANDVRRYGFMRKEEVIVEGGKGFTGTTC